MGIGLGATTARFALTVGHPIALEPIPKSPSLVPSLSGAEWGARERSNVTVFLTADHYVRLLWGRLDISHAVETGSATAEDPGEAAKLNRIFPGR